MAAVISPQQAKTLLDTRNALLVDIREPDEYARERIEGSRLAPLSVLPSLPLDPDTRRPAIFFCQSGRRARKNDSLLKSRNFKESYLMDGGIEGWKEAGLPVIRSGLSSSTASQAKMASGGLILFSVLLGLLHPAFLWLTAFAGTVLLFAGATGISLMEKILGRMPWNRKETGG